MMRLKNILLLFLICQVTAFAQNNDDGFYNAQYECAYCVKFIDDTINMIPGIEDRLILQIGNDLSYQYIYRKQQGDSIISSIITNNEEIVKYFQNQIEEMRNSNLREGGFSRNIALLSASLYKDYKANKIHVTDHISSHYFIYEESLMPQNWEMQDDTTTIAGYACQKAVCDYRGRSYEAWFTPEIPVNEGPWKFHGLPGLILRLNDSQHHYEFELVEFKKTDKIINARPITTNEIVRLPHRKYMKIERKELLKIQWGKKGDLLIEAEMAKVGLSYTQQIRHHDDIERDYK